MTGLSDHQVLAARVAEVGGSPCQADPELWFGEPDEQEVAASYCRSCPALAACTQYLAANPERYGTWAERTEQSRRPKVGRPRKTTEQESAA